MRIRTPSLLLILSSNGTDRRVTLTPPWRHGLATGLNGLRSDQYCVRSLPYPSFNSPF